MRNSVRLGALATAAAAATALAALPAGAAPTTDKPKPPPTGQIVVCNHSGYLFNVFADGASIREDDLGGSFDECTDWAPVKTGGYEIGFGLKLATSQRVIIQARFKRHGHVYYKSFNGEGLVKSNVGEHETLRVDLYIPQG
jgi:hypothetical protein